MTTHILFDVRYSRRMITLHGELLAYCEQGMEGRIEFAFAPDRSNEIIFLAAGQHLTIHGPHGEALWAGRIEFIRVGWRDKSDLKVWSDVKQKGVRYDTWMRWFWCDPPLRATLDSP